MTHLLDNPAWNALLSGNKSLAEGNERVKFFPRDVAPFVGFKDSTPADFELLYELLPADSIVAVVTPEDFRIPERWKLMKRIRALQMVCDNPASSAIPRQPANPGQPAVLDNDLIPLAGQHVPAMIALTKMTNPGPFHKRTIDFGNYTGIFNGDQLIAMAGYRMQPSPYVEVSAVCTHPDHLGKGYAAALILHLAARIRASDGIPFLHVRNDNERAIKLYKKLGFATRREMSIGFIQLPSRS